MSSIKAFRVTGEMTWFLGTTLRIGKLKENEANKT